MKKRKWVLIGSYNPHKDKIRDHLDSISKLLNELSIKYDNFNSEMHEEPMNIFCTTYNLKNLVKEPTCFKNIDNPSCIDLILTNKPSYFQTTTVVETGISDFHKLTLTIIKSTLPKVEPKIFHYRNYTNFDNQTFRNELLFEIRKKGFQNIISAEFKHLFIMTLNKYAPTKTKYLRANNSPFMNKELAKG